MAKLDLNNTFGALLIGVVVSAALFGVTSVQTFYYFQNYSSDGILVKAVVITLFIFEALHSAFGIHAMYYYTILNYLNPTALVKATWSATMTLAVSSAIMMVVHLFYAKRVYHMSRKNIPLVSLIVLLALAHLGTGIAVTVRAFQLEFYASFAKITGIVDTSLALGVVTDVIVAGSLTYYLHSRRSGIRSTDTLITKLMIYSINNGVLTSVFDIIVLAFVTTHVDNLIFLSIFQVVGNLYTNSMLATLNSRQKLSDNTELGSGRVTTLRMHNSASTRTAGSNFSMETKPHVVEITTSQAIHTDSDDLEAGSYQK